MATPARNDDEAEEQHAEDGGVVEFDVRGRRFRVAKGTLRAFPDSLLCTIASDDLRVFGGSGASSADGIPVYPFDRDPKLFEQVLNLFYQRQRMLDQAADGQGVYWPIDNPSPADGAGAWNSFKDELAFFTVVPPPLAHHMAPALKGLPHASTLKRYWGKRELEQQATFLAQIEEDLGHIVDSAAVSWCRWHRSGEWCDTCCRPVRGGPVESVDVMFAKTRSTYDEALALEAREASLYPFWEPYCFTWSVIDGECDIVYLDKEHGARLPSGLEAFLREKLEAMGYTLTYTPLFLNSSTTTRHLYEIAW